MYPFQQEISNRIIDSTLHGKGEELFLEVARQSGKTTAIVDTLAFLNTFIHEYHGYPYFFGVFAPQFEQAKTDFDRLEDELNVLKAPWRFDYAESNGNTIELKFQTPTGTKPGSTTYCFSLSEGSNVESKTNHVQIFEEAHLTNDRRMMSDAFPMGASTNATRIFIGPAGYRLCYFYRGIENDRNVLKVPFDEVIAQKRQAFEKTGDPRHLDYEKFIYGDKETGRPGEIDRLGFESDEFKTQYRLIWALEAGMFTTRTELEELRASDRELITSDKDFDCYAGIDTAKSPDRWIVTVGRRRGGIEKLETLAWLELQGDNYLDMCQASADFFSRYKILGLAIDATGQDFVPDWFYRNTGLPLTRIAGAAEDKHGIPFTLQNKHILYQNLTNLWRNRLIDYPYGPEARTHPYLRRFEQEMLTLEKEWKGQYLSCHHPDEKDAHDDYPDSLALMAYAATYGGFADPAAVASGGVSPTELIGKPPKNPGSFETGEELAKAQDNPLLRDMENW